MILDDVVNLLSRNSLDCELCKMKKWNCPIKLNVTEKGDLTEKQDSENNVKCHEFIKRQITTLMR